MLYRKKRNKYFNDILKYCRNNSIEIAINILESGLSNEEALMTECWYINEYICTYGFNITNKTWGGRGWRRSIYDVCRRKNKIFH